MPSPEWLEEALMTQTRSQVVCPFCEYVLDIAEDTFGLVTVHGSDGEPVPVCCPNCDEDFAVFEHVERTFTITQEQD